MWYRSPFFHNNHWRPFSGRTFSALSSFSLGSFACALSWDPSSPFYFCQRLNWRHCSPFLQSKQTGGIRPWEAFVLGMWYQLVVHQGLETIHAVEQTLRVCCSFGKGSPRIYLLRVYMADYFWCISSNNLFIPVHTALKDLRASLSAWYNAASLLLVSFSNFRDLLPAAIRWTSSFFSSFDIEIYLARMPLMSLVRALTVCFLAFLVCSSTAGGACSTGLVAWRAVWSCTQRSLSDIDWKT